jgi:hypothetical protein
MSLRGPTRFGLRGESQHRNHEQPDQDTDRNGQQPKQDHPVASLVRVPVRVEALNGFTLRMGPIVAGARAARVTEVITDGSVLESERRSAQKLEVPFGVPSPVGPS